MQAKRILLGRNLSEQDTLFAQRVGGDNAKGPCTLFAETFGESFKGVFQSFAGKGAESRRLPRAKKDRARDTYHITTTKGIEKFFSIPFPMPCSARYSVLHFIILSEIFYLR